MFRYEYPEFEKKHLLKVEMLEQLRDYPRNFSSLLFQGYGDGIINGCEISWKEGRLTINSGIICWRGFLYFLEKPLSLASQQEDQQRYLNVKFLKEKREAGKIYGETSIYLSNRVADSTCEMELCRFRLQPGAKLRNSYQDFSDYVTEYDTVNMIYVPFAELGGSTISPQILMSFANEMMETKMTDPYNISFCINVLANQGKIQADCAWQYVERYSEGETMRRENIELYQGLLRILKSRNKYLGINGKKNQPKKGIMLV